MSPRATPSSEKPAAAADVIERIDAKFPAAGLVATAGGTGYHVYVAMKHSKLGYDFPSDMGVGPLLQELQALAEDFVHVLGSDYRDF